MDSLTAFETDSETPSDNTDQNMKDTILHILPTIKQHCLAAFLEFLEKMGVECADDLKYLTEADVTQTLSPIQARKLISGLKHVGIDTPCPPDRATSLDSPTAPSTSTASSPQSSHSSQEVVIGAPMHSHRQPVPSVPWQKMPPQLMLALEDKRRPAPSLRKEMVRIIIDNLDGPHKARPSAAVLRSISNEVIKKYPESFTDEVAGETVGSGYESLLSQLVHRVDNIRRPSLRKTRYRYTSLDDSCSSAKKKKDSYGCVHWQPLALPDGETEASQQTTKEELKLIHRSEPNTNRADINKKMAITYATQRAAINKPDCSLLDLVEEWPYLFDEQCMLLHFSELVGINIKLKMEQSFQHKIPKILRFLKKHPPCLRNKKLQQKLQEVDEAIEAAGNNFPQVIGLLCLLCTYFGEQQGCHVVSNEELGSPINKESLPGNPCLIAYGKLLEASKWSLAIGDMILLDVCNSVTAISVLFASYYVFNLQYPKGSTGAMEFIQRCLAGINPKEGNKTGRKTGVHAGVLKLANDLKSFENEWNL